VKHNGCFSTGTFKRPIFWREKQEIGSKKIPLKKEDHFTLLEQLAQRCNIRKPADWYKVTQSDIDKLGGDRMLKTYYDNSLHKVMFEYLSPEKGSDALELVSRYSSLDVC